MEQLSVAQVEETSAHALEREKKALALWRELEDPTRLALIDMVYTEMQRLTASVPNWLPASVQEKNDLVQICFTIRKPTWQTQRREYPDGEDVRLILEQASQFEETLQGIVEAE